MVRCGVLRVEYRASFRTPAFAIKLSMHMTQIKPIRNSFTKSRQLLVNWLLACTLLISQTLGMMHGVVHGLQPVSGSWTSTGLRVLIQIEQMDQADQLAQVAQTVQADANSINATNWVDALFSSHHGANDCRLYDQASHGSLVPPVVALALPVVLPPLAVAIFQGQALARWAALFDARGPPLTS